MHASNPSDTKVCELLEQGRTGIKTSSRTPCARVNNPRLRCFAVGMDMDLSAALGIGGRIATIARRQEIFGHCNNHVVAAACCAAASEAGGVVRHIAVVVLTVLVAVAVMVVMLVMLVMVMVMPGIPRSSSCRACEINAITWEWLCRCADEDADCGNCIRD
jgi:hypothetical protein